MLDLERDQDGLSFWSFADDTPSSAAYRIRLTPSLGMHAVARRLLQPGELLLLEEPLVSTRSAVAEGLPSMEPEWELVHALLTIGKRCDWAAQFASLAPTEAPDRSLASWLCKKHNAVTAADVEAIWHAVRSNAFSLETPLLGVEYGAAFYVTACRFNHSCRPNCHSVRLGGNMAIFASERIEVGEELRHSYLPQHLLACPRSRRRAHIHFACDCLRCAAGVAEPAETFPPTAATEVARFLVACAVSEPRTTLWQGAELLRKTELQSQLRTSPLAALEICRAYLGAHWALSASSEGATDADSQDKAQLRAAAALQAEAAAALCKSAAADATAPHAQLAHLAASAVVQASVLGAFADRDGHEGVQDVQGALGALATAFGGAHSWLRDDLPFLNPEVAQRLLARLVERD